MNVDTEDLELYDSLLDLHFLRLCKMYKELKKMKKRRVRRWRVNPYNQGYSRYNNRKVFHNMNDEEFFLNTRMSRPTFTLLLNLIGNKLRRSRQTIDAEERLAITLAYLASGSSIQRIALSRNLGKTTVRNIVFETCEALWSILSVIYVKRPTEDQYRKIEEDFNRIWDIPNCIGAIASKQIAMRWLADPQTKNITSIVLTAACDADYIFTAVSVGTYEKETHKGTYSLSPFGKKTKLNEIPIPPNKPLSETSTEPFPHYFVAYSAYPFRSNIMWPYNLSNNDATKLVFNYRLYAANNLIENCMGVLSARWKILLTLLESLPQNCEIIVLACVALHNFIMMNDIERNYCPSHYVDSVTELGNAKEGEWRNEIKAEGFKPLESLTSNGRNYTVDNRELRNELAEHFFNEVEPE